MPGLTGSVPSRLGLRGSENLGGGLKAHFTLEQGIGVARCSSVCRAIGAA